MNRWPWLLVLLGSILLFLAIGDRRTSTAPPTAATLAGEPDLFMTKAQVTQYSDDGSVSYRLRSDEARHFESDDSTQLVSPTLTLNRAPQPDWLATAKQGHVTYRDTPAEGKREEVVELSGDVRLQRPGPPNRIELKSAAMLVYPDRQFAETDQPVMITGDTGRTSAIGMSGDLNLDLFNLTSSATQRVDTVVQPGQFKPAPAQSPQ